MGRRLRVPTTHSVAASFDEHGAFVWRSLRHLGVDDAGLDDAVQDVFVTAFRRQADFEGRSTERTWLFGIARRIAFRYRRAARSRERRLAPMESRAAEATVEPHRRADARQSIAQLVGALDRDKRAVFVLCEIEGMTAAEVAEVLSLPIGTVHSRRRAAWQRLSSAAAQDVRLLRPRVAELGSETPPEHRSDQMRALLIAAVGVATTKVATGLAVAAAIVVGLLTVAVTNFGDDDPPAVAPRVVATAPPAEATATRPVPSTRAPTPATPPVAPAAVPAMQPTSATPPPPQPPAKAAVPAEDALTAELELLQTARRFVDAAQWKAAVRVLDRHERRFAGGQLRAERDELLVRALCEVGARQRAIRIARRLRPDADDPCSR